MWRAWQVLLALVVTLQLVSVLLTFRSDLGLWEVIAREPELGGTYRKLSERASSSSRWRSALGKKAPGPGKNGVTGPMKTSLIPAIIHQYWDTEAVPRVFAPWMRSWARLHPRWAYWLWTAADVRRLVARRYPHLEDVLRAYPDGLHRADAMRYLVLHEYGGLYADLDVRALRPLDPWRAQGGVLLSQEPAEHTYFFYNSTAPGLMNTIMAARPRHPFFAALVSALRDARDNGDVLNTTGPVFLTDMYRRYTQTLTSPEHNVTVLDPKYLLPTYDQDYRQSIWRRCQTKTRYRRMRPEQRAVCRRQARGRWQNRPGPDAYTDHYWYHVMAKPAAWRHNNTLHADHIVPHRQDMKHII